MRPKNLNALINLPPPGLCAHFRQSWRLNDGIYGSCLHLQNLSASVVQFWTHHCTYNDEDGGSLAETNDTKGVFPFSVESARSPPPLWQLRGQKRRMDPIRAISAPAVHWTSANFSHSQSEDEEVLWRGGSIMKRRKYYEKEEVLWRGESMKNILEIWISNYFWEILMSCQSVWDESTLRENMNL